MNPSYTLAAHAVWGALILRASEAIINARRADDSATQAKVASRRAVVEVMSTILFSLGSFIYVVWSLIHGQASIFSCGIVLADAGIMLFSAFAAHGLANSIEAPTDVPRHFLLGVRRSSRYVSYFSGLQRRLWLLRLWWCSSAVWYALAVVLPAQAQARGSEGTAASVEDAVYATVQLCLTFVASHPGLTALLTLRLVTAVLAAISVCAWRASDWDGRCPKQKAQWLWPSTQQGEHPAQRAPARLLSLKTSNSIAAAASAASPQVGTGPGHHHGAMHMSRASEAAALAQAYPGSQPPALAPTPRPLRIVIITLGTRGDVQPFLAWAVYMKEQRHHPVICTSRDFKTFVESYGIEWADAGIEKVRQAPAWSRVSSVSDMLRATAPDLIEDYPLVSRGFTAACTTPSRADVVVGTAMTLTFALNISEAYNIPCWFTKLAPDIITRGFVHPGSMPSPIGWWNYLRCLGYWLNISYAVQVAGINRAEEDFREWLGLSRAIVASKRIAAMEYTPQLLAYSEILFPKPLDYPFWAFQVGFWQFMGGSQGAPDMPADDDEEDEEDSESAESGTPKRGGTGPGRVASNAAAGHTPGKAGVSDSAPSPAASSPAPAPPASAVVDPALKEFVVHGDLAPASCVDRETGAVLNRRQLDAWIAARGLPYETETRTAVLTFGSMERVDRPGLLQDLLTILLAPNRRLRVVVLTGWAGQPADAPRHPRVHYAKEAPHDWLFRQALFVVHHGGAGTTACALACGAASVVLPILRWTDQPLWGWLVHKLGVGTLIQGSNPDIYEISAAVDSVLREAPKTDGGLRMGAPFTGSPMCDRANSLGAAVRAEPSADTGLALLESCLCNLVLPPAQADAIHPSVSLCPDASKLSAVQAMCAENCVACARLRGQLLGLPYAVGASFCTRNNVGLPLSSPLASTSLLDASALGGMGFRTAQAGTGGGEQDPLTCMMNTSTGSTASDGWGYDSAATRLSFSKAGNESGVVGPAGSPPPASSTGVAGTGVPDAGDISRAVLTLSDLVPAGEGAASSSATTSKGSGLRGRAGSSSRAPRAANGAAAAAGPSPVFNANAGHTPVRPGGGRGAKRSSKHVVPGTEAELSGLPVVGEAGHTPGAVRSRARATARS